MANDEVGSLVVKVGMDNSGFQNGVSSLNRQLKVVQSQFQSATAKLGEFGSNTDKLKLKADALSQQMEIQKQKVQSLEQAFQTSADKKGLDAKATQDLEIKLNKAVVELSKMEMELKKTNSEIEKQSSGWTKLAKKAEEASNKFKSVGSKMSQVGKDLSMKITAPILAVGAASVKLASDMNESMNKVEVAFGDSADSVKDWSDTTLKSFGIAKGTALDMSSLFGDMGTSMGLGQEEASKMSMSLVGLAGDLSSFKNIGIKEAETALNGIFTGETESLKRLGVVMTQANLQQYAYSQGIQTNIQDMTEAEKVQLRYNYVLEKTKNAHGDFERTGGGAANQMRIFSESLKEVGASFGEYILPVITPIITKVNEWIQAFGKLDDKTKKTILVVGGIVAAIAPILLITGKLLGAIGLISGAFATVSGAIAVVTTGAVAATPAVGALAGVFTVLTGPIGIVIATIAGLIGIFTVLYRTNEGFRENVNTSWNNIKNSISTVIDSIKAVVMKFVEIANELWNIHGDQIIKIVNGFLNIIVTIFDTTFKVISDVFQAFSALLSGDWDKFFESIKNIAKNILDAIVSIIQSGFSIIKNVFVILKNAGISIFGDLLRGIRDKVSDIVSSVKSGIQDAIDWIKDLPDKMLSLGKDIIQGLIDGIKEKIKALKDAVKDVADTVSDKIKDTLDINSPSRVMIKVGQFVTDGLAIGISNEKDKLTRAMNNVSNYITSSAKSAVLPNASTINNYSSQPSSTINIEKMIHIEGNVDNSTIPRVEKVAKDSVKHLENMLRRNGAFTQIKGSTV